MKKYYIIQDLMDKMYRSKNGGWINNNIDDERIRKFETFEESEEHIRSNNLNYSTIIPIFIDEKFVQL